MKPPQHCDHECVCWLYFEYKKCGSAAPCQSDQCHYRTGATPAPVQCPYWGFEQSNTRWRCKLNAGDHDYEDAIAARARKDEREIVLTTENILSVLISRYKSELAILDYVEMIGCEVRSIPTKKRQYHSQLDKCLAHDCEGCELRGTGCPIPAPAAPITAANQGGTGMCVVIEEPTKRGIPEIDIGIAIGAGSHSLGSGVSNIPELKLQAYSDGYDEGFKVGKAQCANRIRKEEQERILSNIPKLLICQRSKFAPHFCGDNDCLCKSLHQIEGGDLCGWMQKIQRGE
jgi:hypothetical protein